jgi:hypothetical protein
LCRNLLKIFGGPLTLTEKREPKLSESFILSKTQWVETTEVVKAKAMKGMYNWAEAEDKEGPQAKTDQDVQP